MVRLQCYLTFIFFHFLHFHSTGRILRALKGMPVIILVFFVLNLLLRKREHVFEKTMIRIFTLKDVRWSL